MTHEHKIGIGITCTFLCLTGAVIGLKMRDQPLPETAVETAPKAEPKPEQTPLKPVKPFVSPADLAARMMGEQPNSEKGIKVTLVPIPFDPTKVSTQTNTKQVEADPRAKNTQNSTAVGAHPSSPKATTTETKTNGQTIKEAKNENNAKEAFSWLSPVKPTAKTSTENQSSGNSFQMVGGMAPAMENSSNSPVLTPTPNPEEYFTKAIPVPMLPDMVITPQGATALTPPVTTVAAPSTFAPLQTSSPPPPMPPIGSGSTSPSFALRPGETSSPPPPKPDWSSRTSTPTENKPATPAWQPPLANKTEDSKPAPLIPAAVPPTPTPSPSGTKPPDGSYFIQDPHSSTNSAASSPGQGGDKAAANVPAPLPLPPLPGGTESGRANASGLGRSGENASAGMVPPVRPAPQVIVYDEIDYVCQPGDTFAKISARWYQTEAFAEALKRHNQHHARASEQMAKYGTITPGEKIVIPPADILEQRYGDALVKPTVAPANQMTPASYTPPPVPSGNSQSPPRP